MAEKIKTRVKDTFPPQYLSFWQIYLFLQPSARMIRKRQYSKQKGATGKADTRLGKQTLTKKCSCVKKHSKRNEINYFLAKGLNTDDFVQLFRILHARCFISIYSKSNLLQRTRYFKRKKVKSKNVSFEGLRKQQNYTQ